MADLRLRQIERAAASGDVESQARALLERVRAGSLSRERLELAAYCGDAGAGEAIRPEGANVPRVFATWAAGFTLWDQGPVFAHLRAAVAAAWVAGRSDAEVCCCGDTWGASHEGHSFTHACDYCGVSCRCDPSPDVAAAIQAAAAWIADPCARTGDAWSRTYRPSLPLWVPVSTMALEPSDGSDTSHRLFARQAIMQAAAVAGSGAVRAAIQRALIAWALCPSPSPPAPHVDPDPELPPTPVAELAGDAP